MPVRPATASAATRIMVSILPTSGDRVTGLRKGSLAQDAERDHGCPVTTIRPRPIVAAAMAFHTDSSGAPFGKLSVVRSA